MANVATLRFEVAGKHTRIRSAKYRVPLFWLACFEGKDTSVATDEDGEAEVSLATTQARALSLIEARRGALESVVTNLDDFLPAWLAILRGLGEARLVVDPTEVLLMTEGDDLAAPLRSALGFFDAPTEQGAIALIQLSSLGEHIDPRTHRVATPPRKSARDVVPDLAADALLPEDPALEALIGHGVPAAPDPVPPRWPMSRVLAALAALSASAISVSGYLTGRQATKAEAVVLVVLLLAAAVLWNRPRRTAH